MSKKWKSGYVEIGELQMSPEGWLKVNGPSTNQALL